METNSSNEVASSSTDSTGKDNPPEEKSVPATPAQTALRGGPSWTGAIIMSIVVSFGMSVISVWIYDYKYAQKVVSVDIKGYTARQGEAYMAGKITEEQFRKSFDHLQQVVESIPPNKAVLLGDLVVRNVEKINP